MPVEMGHHIGFHVVHQSSLFGLVDWERFQGLSVVVELCQDHCVVARDQWTGGVAIILQRTRKLLYEP